MSCLKNPVLIENILQKEPDNRSRTHGESKALDSLGQGEHQTLSREIGQSGQDGKRSISRYELGRCHNRLAEMTMPAISNPQMLLTQSRAANMIGSSSILPLCAIMTMRLIQ